MAVKEKKKHKIMKRKLSCNGQQFHQYQSPLTEHKKGATLSDVGNACHGLGQDNWIGSEKNALQQGTPMTTPNN
jgi:hypothetical protein